MPNPEVDYGVGDIVQWVPGEKYDESLPNGPFVVLNFEAKDDCCVRVKRLDTGEILKAGAQLTGFWTTRFRKDQFLSAVRDAQNQVRSR